MSNVSTTIFDIEKGVASIITSKYTTYYVTTSVVTPVTTFYGERALVITGVLSRFHFAGKLVTEVEVPTNYTTMLGTYTSVVRGTPVTSVVTELAGGQQESGGPIGGGGGGGGGKWMPTGGGGAKATAVPGKTVGPITPPGSVPVPRRRIGKRRIGVPAPR